MYWENFPQGQKRQCIQRMTIHPLNLVFVCSGSRNHAWFILHICGCVDNFTISLFHEVMLGVLNMKWSIMLHFYRRGLLLKGVLPLSDASFAATLVLEKQLRWFILECLSIPVVMQLMSIYPFYNLVLIFCNDWAWSNVHVYSYTLSSHLSVTLFFF